MPPDQQLRERIDVLGKYVSGEQRGDVRIFCLRFRCRFPLVARPSALVSPSGHPLLEWYIWKVRILKATEESEFSESMHFACLFPHSFFLILLAWRPFRIALASLPVALFTLYLPLFAFFGCGENKRHCRHRRRVQVFGFSQSMRLPLAKLISLSEQMPRKEYISG